MLMVGPVMDFEGASKENIRTTLITVVLLQATFLRGSSSKPRVQTDQLNLRVPLCSMEWNAYLFNHLINFLLPHEQNRGRENTLEEFISDTFVDSSDTLVLYDREETIERGLVLGVTGLEPALHDTKNHGENSSTRPGKPDLHIRVRRPSCNCESSVKSLDSHGKRRSPNFESAPSKKKSRSVKTAAAVAAPAARNAVVRRATSTFLSCSKDGVLDHRVDDEH
jgi:hypothetical protein